MADTNTSVAKAAGGGGNPAAAGALDSADLDLVDDNLDDAGKSREDHWNELEAEEKAKAGETAETPETAAPDGEQGEEGAEGEGEQAEADPWAAAPAELRAERDRLAAENKRLEQSERSQRGRVSALQRQLDKTQAAAKPAGEQGNGAAKKPKAFTSEKGKSFEAEYPDVAAPVAEELEQVRGELEEAKQVLSTIVADKDAAAVAAETQRLFDEIPDWRDAIRSDPAAFAEWVKTQPRPIREAADRNAEKIVDAEEAALVMGRYQAFRSEQGDDAQAQDEDDAEETPTRVNGSGKTGNSLQNRRQRQLESSASSRAGGRSTANVPPEGGTREDDWAYFDALDNAKKVRQA